MTYGERFRELRKKYWGDRRVIDLARALGKDHPQTIYGIEERWRVPALDTIVSHAKALGCDPWELLDGVETEFDLGRAINKASSRAVASARWGALMKRHELSKRGYRLRDSSPAKRKRSVAKAS